MKQIVIAHRAGAQVFDYLGNNKFELVSDHPNPLGRLKNKSMTDDQPGLSRAKSMTASPHSLSKEKSKHDEAAEQFAIDLAKTLESNLKGNSKLNYLIVAEPGFMGELKKNLETPALEDQLQYTNKDLVNTPQIKWKKILGL